MIFTSVFKSASKYIYYLSNHSIFKPLLIFSNLKIVFLVVDINDFQQRILEARVNTFINCSIFNIFFPGLDVKLSEDFILSDIVLPVTKVPVIELSCKWSINLDLFEMLHVFDLLISVGPIGYNYDS